MPSETHPKDVELPDSLTLAVGERWSFELPGLGSAGYQWSATTAEPETVSCSIELQPEPPVERAGGVRPPPTFDVASLVTLVGKTIGESTVQLTLARSWETDVAPLRSHEITVAVVSAD